MFETGAKTAAANNLVLSVTNNGAVYEARKATCFRILNGEPFRVSIRDLVDEEARKQRVIGGKFRLSDIADATRIVEKETIVHCLELIRDDWDKGQKITAVCRRWFDAVNGNSYFSLKFLVPKTGGGLFSFNSPFQYGYGSHPHWVAVNTLEKLGYFTRGANPLSDCPVDFSDNGYMQKRRMFKGVYL